MLTDIKLGHVIENAFNYVVSSVSTVFLRNIHSHKRFTETHPKEVLYLDVGITK